jgi:hypothetical protein
MSNSPSVTFAELENAAAKPAPPAEPQATPAAPEIPSTPAQVTPQFTEADASALRTLADLGITPQNASQYKQAMEVLNRLPGILDSNPDVFFNEIARNNPTTYKKILEHMSDKWYENWQREHPEGTQPPGTASSTASSTDPRIESKLNDLTSKLEGLISRQNQELTEKQNTQILNGYNSAVDELLAKLPKETPELTKDHIRLKTNELLWKDTGSRDRVAKGVYVDLSSHFAKACSLVTADTKAASKTEHERRSEVESRGSRDITPAAENVNGTAQQTAPGEDPNWGTAGMVADLKKALSAR